MSSFLKAGIPLKEIEPLRELLKEHAYSLSDRRGMCDLIPSILMKEQQQTKAELQGKNISVIFD